MAKIVALCFVISWRMSHLGMNPVNGGSPPIERRVNVDMAASVGVFCQDEDRVEILVDESVFSDKNMAVVMVM